MMKLKQRMFLALAATLLLAAGTAQAQISLVTTRPGLGGTDFIDWGALGATGTVVNTPFNILSNNSLNVNVNQAISPGQRLDQGNGWGGNFTNGDRLYYTGQNTVGGAGPITLNFGTSLSAFGANIQEDFFGNFVARLTFFDALNNQVGTVTEAGVSNGNGDGSAIFIGGISGGPGTNFNSVVVSIDSADGGPTTAFAINRADFSLGAAVPEPTSLALMGATVVVGAGAWWQRRRKFPKKVVRS